MHIDFLSPSSYLNNINKRNILLAIVLLVLCLTLFCLGVFRSGEKEGAEAVKTIFNISGAVFSSFLVWPTKELILNKNRLDLVKTLHKEYQGPPQPDSDRCAEIRKKLDEILTKTI